MAEIPILLLAAGASHRMGQAKQLLPWGEHSLIEYQVQILLRTGQPVVVVLGHLWERIAPLLESFSVVVLKNKQWDRGMGTTIAFGIRELEKKFPMANGALIAQVDQPLITGSHFDKLLSFFRQDSQQIIVSRSSSGWEGVPVLFDRYYFKALQTLDGEAGARKIFRQYSPNVNSIESSDVLEDMDTPEAYQEFLTEFSRRSRSNAV
jgi:molybdenum cofactor cytidylyltransferase